MLTKIIAIIMFIGVLIVLTSFSNKQVDSSSNDPEPKCKPKIVYRYIPRTAEEDKAEPVYVSDVFKKMFQNPSPWVRSINDADYDKMKKVNDYFVSQA